MPTVFTDEVGAADVTIQTSANWTIHAAALPNGDNAATCAAGTSAGTYYLDPSPSTLDIVWGSGSEGFTIEFWIEVAAAALDRIVCLHAPSPIVASGILYVVTLKASEQIELTMFNSSSAVYLSVISGVLSAGWHHVVFLVSAGSSRGANIYVDNAVNLGSTTGPTGTPGSPTSTSRFSLGQTGDGNQAMTSKLAKVALYSRMLTVGEIDSHYLSMTAS